MGGQWESAVCKMYIQKLSLKYSNISKYYSQVELLKSERAGEWKCERAEEWESERVR